MTINPSLNHGFMPLQQFLALVGHKCYYIRQVNVVNGGDIVML